ncbi:MAG: hypothetical protein WCO04_01570 [Pseudomonadota bacterium]|jgi:hypothetical protein
MTENKGRVIEVLSNNLNSGLQQISPVAFDFEYNQVFFIDDEGEIQRRQKTEKDNLFYYSLSQKRKLDGDRGFQWFDRFTVYDNNKDGNFANEAQARNNKKLLGLEKYLKQHPDVSWRDASGKENNTNCRTALFAIIDEQGIAQQSILKAENTTKAVTIITDSFKNDNEEFMEYVYGLGFGSMLEVKTPDSICAMLIGQAQMDPNLFLSYFNSADRELTYVLKKATTQVNGIVPDITSDDGLFFMNGNVIAKGFDELKAYFKGKPQEYAYLQEKYAKKKVVKKTSPSDTKAKP